VTIHLTLTEIDAHIDALDRAEPTQNPMHWRRAFESLKSALEDARRIRSLLIPPGIVLALALLWWLHGDSWELTDARTGVGFFVIVLALGHLALGARFAALKREARIAALLRYYGAKDVPEEEALL